MSDIKPSGIRPPSKIDRPTCTVTPKPAIPPRSINSMEPLWETHGRRLSEAGVRRGSDNSVVLTEDTDSFIIGDHVWVGGTKPGQIAYIGETQFAPGDWAGIVLDDPIGKNDGSVAGYRYFQCEPKRGIFSRLTRLTRQPIASGLTSPTSPVDSIRGFLNKSMSPSLNTSTTSLSSASHRDAHIGERVIVSSSQGSKTGVLRYVGPTEFAPGEWCGVELDDPLGKNDGSVNDKRYFECRAKYGLFAPAHKVSRSPSNKRSMCLVHRPTGAALSASLRKAGSRESLASAISVASNATSIASRATTAASNSTARLQKAGLIRTSTPVRKTTQEILKDRQTEIESLRKERDLERERVTKAANQADEAEKVVVTLKKEYEKYRDETEKLAQDAQKNLSTLLEEKHLLIAQLEEERRKCEDLLFRFEEESINKDDIQKENSEQSVANSIYENKIKDLEKQLSEERERVIQLERDSTKLFETEEELTKLRIDKQNTTAGGINEFSSLQKRYEDLEKTEVELKCLLEKKNETVDRYITEINEINEKLKEKEKENLTQEEYKSNLHKQLEEATKQLQEKCAYIDELNNKYKIQTENLQKEIQQLKETIKNITDDNAVEKMKLIEVHEKILKENNEAINSQNSAFKLESERISGIQQEYLQELRVENERRINELTESFKSQLVSKDVEIDRLYNEFDKKVSEETNSLFLELSKLKTEHAEVIETISTEKYRLEREVASLTRDVNTLNIQLSNLTEQLQAKDSQLSESYQSKLDAVAELKKQFKEQMESKNKDMQDIVETNSQKSSKLSFIEVELTSLKSTVENKNEEIRNLNENNLRLEESLTNCHETINDLEFKLLSSENQLKELNEKYKISEEKINQLTTEKEKLKTEISSVVSTSVDSSDKLIKYNEELRQKEKELDEARNKEFELRELVVTIESKANTAKEEVNKLKLLSNEIQLENEKVKSDLALEKQEKQNIAEKCIVNERKEQELINKIKYLEEDLKKRTLEYSNLTNSLKMFEETNTRLVKELSAAFEEHKTKKFQLEKQISEGGNDQIILKENIDTLEKLNAQLLSDQQAMDASMKEVKENLQAKNQHVLQLESLVNNKDLQLKEVITNLENLKVEKEIIKKSLLEINMKYNDALAELTLLKSSNSNLESQMSLEVANLKQQLEDEKNTLDTALKESKNYLDELTKELTIVSESNVKSNQRCLEMETIILTKEREIQILNENLISEKDNNETTKQQLQMLQENLLVKSNEILSNVTCITSLNENIKTLESGIHVMKTDLENKTKVIAKLENIINEIKKSNEDKHSNNIQEQQNKMDTLLKKYEQELNSKDSIILELKNEIENKKKIEHEFNQKKINTEELIQKYEQDLSLKDRIIFDLKQIEQQLKERVLNFTEQINCAHEKFSNLQESQRCTENENKQLLINYNEVIAKLNIDNVNLKNSTNNDKLNCKFVNQKTEENAKSITNASDSELEKLKEEYDMAKSQIDFLNSVIVDMQRKNESMSCKIQVLEMGIPTQEADDYNLNLLEKKMKPTRKFCDICDQFDLHETEDCPQQDQDPEPIKSKSEKKIPIQRPYCENCEIFGHNTLSCEETETY